MLNSLIHMIVYCNSYNCRGLTLTNANFFKTLLQKALTSQLMKTSCNLQEAILWAALDRYYDNSKSRFFLDKDVYLCCQTHTSIPEGPFS